MKEPFVINISREVGSGGHTVGEILARKLGVRYCDKDLLEALEKQFGLNVQSIERLKAEKKSWLADFINKMGPMSVPRAMGLDPLSYQEFHPGVTTDDIYSAEVEILEGFAQLGSCVIAGRSGFFVFRNHPNKLNVLITASMPFRVERVMRKQGLSEDEARKVITAIDQSRETYIRRYAGVDRYDARCYDLVLRADGHTEHQLADIILSYIA